MAEREVFFNSEVAPYKTGKLTLSVVPDIRPALVENYNQIIDRQKSKITIFINDFSGGRGDNAKKVYYNMEIANFHFLYERAKDRNGGYPFFYSKTKIFGAYPEQGGPYKGLCKSFRLVIRRDTKDSKGEILRSPWSITIRNGYGKAIKTQIGGYFEESNSFKEVASVTARLTDEDFLNLFTNIREAYDAHVGEIAKTIIPKGRERAKEIREEGTRVEASSGTDTETAPQIEQTPEAKEPAAPAQPAQSSKQQPKTYAIRAQIVSEFAEIKGKGIAAKVKNMDSEKGTEFVLYFTQIPQEIKAAKSSNTPFHVLIYMKGNDVWTDGQSPAA